MDSVELTGTVNKLKERIIKIEAGKNELSETGHEARPHQPALPLPRVGLRFVGDP